MNKQFRFTKKIIEALPAHKGIGKTKETEYSDTEVSGLKVMVNKAGRKMFYFRFTFNGKKKGMKIGNYPMMEITEARNKAIEAKIKLSQGQDPAQQMESKAKEQSMTYGAFMVQHYLPHAMANKRSGKTDQSRYRNHLKTRFGDEPMVNITPYDVQLFHDKIKQSRCPSTANRYLALLKRSLNLAVLWGFLETTPVRGVRMHQEDNIRKRYLSSDELVRLIRAAQQEPNRSAGNAITLLLYTGVRKQEALDAQWSHIDLTKNLWLLPHTKSGKSRHAILNQAAVDLLTEMKAQAHSNYLFTGRDKAKPLNNPFKAFRRMLKVAGINNFRIHDLRHAYASLAISNGASLYEVQHLLGHASSQTTMRYAHLADEKLRQASANVATAIQNAHRSQRM